jgi:hypothetical protein
MAGRKAIPDEVRAQVKARVEAFNREVVKNPHTFFSVRFRGRYAYLDRGGYGRVRPRARLTYRGDMENWDFAIFRSSREAYDPDEWMFPGAGHVDGTVEGALRAAMQAYP